MYESSVLVLSSGSVKGYVVLGALDVLYTKGMLSNVSTYIGTSVGTILNYMLILGMTPLEIITYVCTSSLGKEYNIAFTNLLQLFQERGLFSFKHILDHIEKMSILQIGCVPTLLELYELTGKKIVLVTYNLTQQKTEYLSFESHPKLNCLDAINMSCNIPFIFGECKINKNVYVDGAISDGYAVRYALSNLKSNERLIGITTIGDKKKHKSITITHQEPETKYLLKLFESLKMQPDERIDEFDKFAKDMKSRANDLYEFLIQLLEVKNAETVRYALSIKDKRVSLIHIPTSNVYSPFNFSLSSKHKIEMFLSGYNHAKTWLRKRE